MFPWDGDDLIVQVHIQPRATRDGFAGIVGDRLRVRITAAPVEGAANAQLIGFLARQFGVAKSSISLLQGHKGKTKVLRIKTPKKTPSQLGLSLHP